MIEKRLLRYNRSASVLLYLAVTAGFLAALCIVAQVYLLSEIVDRVFQKQRTLDEVGAFLALLLALAFLRALIVWSGDVLAQRAASRLKGSLRAALTRHLFTLGLAYAHGERSGELVHVVGEGVEAL